MGCMNNFCGGNSIWWIIILLLLLDNDGNTCDSLIWILLLSRFCNCGAMIPTAAVAAVRRYAPAVVNDNFPQMMKS